MVKQYKAQVKVTELWLDDLGKHNEENAGLNQVHHQKGFGCNGGLQEVSRDPL